MKKLLMATVALCTFASSADAARPFNGWSVGLNGGWNQDRVKFDASGSTLDKKMTFNTGFAGLHFDWTKSQANAFLFGFGFGLGYGFGSPSDTVVDGVNINQGGVVINNTKIEMKIKRKFASEFSTRLGWNFNNKWALYGILAARAQAVDTSFKIHGNGNVGGVVFNGSYETSKESDVVYGFAPGFGFDVRVNESWSVGGQYKYFFENSAKAKFGSESTKAKMSAHNALIRVSYHF